MLAAIKLDKGVAFEWPDYIPYVQYTINTSYQHAIKMTPYEAVYGVKPNSCPVFMGTTDVDSHDGVLQEEDLEPGLIEQDEDDEPIAPALLTQVHDELREEEAWPCSHQCTPPPPFDEDVVTRKPDEDGVQIQQQVNSSLWKLQM